MKHHHALTFETFPGRNDRAGERAPFDISAPTATPLPPDALDVVPDGRGPRAESVRVGATRLFSEAPHG